MFEKGVRPANRIAATHPGSRHAIGRTDTRLEPAVEVLHRPIELRLALGNEHWADAEAQGQPDHARQGARRRPPAGQLAGVVQLHLFGPPQVKS